MLIKHIADVSDMCSWALEGCVCLTGDDLGILMKTTEKTVEM